MAVDIGPKIGMTGENEFRKSLNSINDQIKTLTAETKAATSAFDANDDSQKKLTAQAKGLAQQINLQQEKVSMLSQGLEESVRLYGEYDSKTLKWKQAVANATTTLNTMEGQLKTTNEAIKTEKVEKAKEAWSKFGDVVSASAAAIASAAAAAGAAVAAAGTALVGFTKDGAAYADNILTQSKVTGVAADKLQEMQYAASLVDVSVETISSSMTKNFAAMQKAAEGNEAAAASYEALGINVTNADGTLRDSEEVYWELIDSLKGIDDETTRDALAMDILGKSAKELNPLIEAGSEGMAALGAEAREAGYVLTDDTLGAFGEFQDQMDRMGNGVTAAKNALGTVLLPVLTNLAGDGVDLLGQFTNALLDTDGDLTKLGEVVDEILPQVLDMITAYLPQLLEIVLSIVKSVAATLIENLPTLISALTDLLLTLIDFVTQPDNLAMFITAAIELVVALATGLIQAMPRLLEAAPMLIESLANALIENLPMLIEAAIQLIIAIGEAIVSNLGIVVEKGKEIVESIKEGFQEKVEAAKQWGSDLIKNFIDGIKQKWEDLKASVRNVANTVKDFLGFSEPKEGPLANFHTFAPDMMDLFIQGIKDNTQKLQDQIAQSFNIGGSITGGIADVRGTSSVKLDSSNFDAAVNRMGNQNININFEGSLSQLARVLQPAIKTENRRLGATLVG